MHRQRQHLICAAAALTALAACQHQDPNPAAPTPAAARDGCTPHVFENDRLRSIGINGMGMDICDDGRVKNWDGKDAGQVMTKDGRHVTIVWRPGFGGDGYSGTDTVLATPVDCRQSGALEDC